jgi:hypothetical protein
MHLAKCDPSYLTVMLYMTDFPEAPHFSPANFFSIFNRTISPLHTQYPQILLAC